jgi:hypothetical protein
MTPPIVDPIRPVTPSTAAEIRPACATAPSAETCSLHTNFVVPMRLGRFFRDIGRPVTMASQSAPGPADFQRLLEIAHTYGFCRWPPD